MPWLPFFAVEDDVPVLIERFNADPEIAFIVSDDTFERTKELARINKVAYVYRDSPDFSTLIRR